MRSLIQEESNLGANPTDMDFLQPPLFDLGDTSSGIVELFPEVWSALEGLGHPDEKRRQASLAYLAETGAYRLSPLVIYVMATRTTDPDMETRVEVVRLLGSVLSPDSKGNPAPEVVRHQLTTFLSQMRTRQIFALLQVLVDAPRLEADASLDAPPLGYRVRRKRARSFEYADSRTRRFSLWTSSCDSLSRSSARRPLS